MTTWALLQVAWAGDARTPVTLTRDIELPVTAEASPWGFSDVPAVRFFAFGGRWSHRELTSPAVDDGHFLTSCRVDRHRVEMQVALAPARHPEHLPEELVC